MEKGGSEGRKEGDEGIQDGGSREGCEKGGTSA